MRQATVRSVEPVFATAAADPDRAAAPCDAAAARVPCAFRLALGDGSTITARRVVAAVRRAAQCALARVRVRARTSSDVRAIVRTGRLRALRRKWCVRVSARLQPVGAVLQSALAQVGPNNTARVPDWAQAHLVRRPDDVRPRPPARPPAGVGRAK